jgi:hypothetical protein
MRKKERKVRKREEHKQPYSQRTGVSLTDSQGWWAYRGRLVGVIGV